MMEHGIGIQQHSTPSHSRHLVFPAAPVSGLTIEEMVEAALEPGPLRLTRLAELEVHISAVEMSALIKMRSEGDKNGN